MCTVSRGWRSCTGSATSVFKNNSQASSGHTKPRQPCCSRWTCLHYQEGGIVFHPRGSSSSPESSVAIVLWNAGGQGQLLTPHFGNMWYSLSPILCYWPTTHGDPWEFPMQLVPRVEDCCPMALCAENLM